MRITITGDSNSMKQVYPPWRDEHSNTNFPFTDSSNLISVNGVELPKNLIVDAAIHPPGLTGSARLQSITIRNRSLTFTISSDDGVVLCQGSWPPLDDQSDISVVPLATSDSKPAGVLVVNPRIVSHFMLRGSSEFIFVRDQAEFVPSVTKFVVDNASVLEGEGELLNQDEELYLVGDRGVVLTCESRQEIIEGELQGVTVIRVNAVGDPLSRRTDCGEAKFETPRFITQVVFQVGEETISCDPSGVGEIFILAENTGDKEPALRISVDQDGINFGLIGCT